VTFEHQLFYNRYSRSNG